MQPADTEVEDLSLEEEIVWLEEMLEDIPRLKAEFELEDWEIELLKDNLEAKKKTKIEVGNFNFFNGCNPVETLVDLAVSEADADQLKISREAIENVLELRLRGARVYPPEKTLQETLRQLRACKSAGTCGPSSTTTLYANVTVTEYAFNFFLEHRKPVTDKWSGVDNYATDFHVGSFLFIETNILIDVVCRDIFHDGIFI